MTGIEWIFFDMGGTLIDESAAWQDRIERTARSHAISADAIRSEMERAAVENLPEYAAAIQRLGIFRREPWSAEKEAPYKSAEPLLRLLKGRFKLGIIANQGLDARKRLEKYGLLDYFDLLIISSEVGFSKPSPILFREALYKADTTAEKCVMVGDKLTNDIAPAKALGFVTVWVRQEWGGMQRPDESSKPDFAVNSLDELYWLAKTGKAFDILEKTT